MRYQTILVATDFSENARRAFERAYDLARQLGAKLYLLHVQDESSLRIALKDGLLQTDSTDEQVKEAVRQLIEERFSQLTAGIDSAEVLIEHTTRRGDPKVVINEFACEINADLVAVGRRGTSLKNIVVGSVADSAIRNAACPVLVVRREHKCD
jgi:nucleotide-binding universal stress UspA family protein